MHTESNQSLPFVLNVKKSLKTGDVVLTWHKTLDNFPAKICYSSNVEVSTDEVKYGWKPFKRTKLGKDSVMPGLAKFDKLGTGQVGYSRLRV